MDDRVETVVGEHPLHGVSVPQVDFSKVDRSVGNPADRIQRGHAAIAEIVNDGQIVTRAQEFNTRVAADVSGTARHENICHLTVLSAGRPRMRREAAADWWSSDRGDSSSHKTLVFARGHSRTIPGRQRASVGATRSPPRGRARAPGHRGGAMR